MWSKRRAAAESRSSPAPHSRGRRSLTLGVVLALLMIAFGGWRAAPASACTCSDSVDLRQAVESAGAVFVGEPIALSRTYATPYGVAELWDFEVERTYAGPSSVQVSVGGAADGDSCHVKLGVYGRVGIVAHWRSGHLSVGLCGVFDADGMVATLGEGERPASAQTSAVLDDDSLVAQAAQEGPPSADAPGATVLRLLAAAGIVLLAFGAVVTMRLRRRLDGSRVQRGDWS